MSLFQRELQPIRLRSLATARGPRAQARRLTLESLEIRQLLTTVPFTIVNNSTIDAAGTRAFQDNQIQIALYAQDYSSATPPYYYFDQTGAAHLTTTVQANSQGVKYLPTFTLNQLTQVSPHTYTIDLPENLPLTTSANGIQSARLYFSMNADLNMTINSDSVGSVNGPTPGNSFFDYVEFSLNAPANPVGNLNIDTTNVDQFGIPIKVTVTTPTADPSNPANGVGISTNRASVISQYQTFTSGANNPFAVGIWPTSDPTYGPYRIQNPSDVLSQSSTAITLLQVQTTLQRAVSSSDTIVNVYCASAFPSAASNFNIQIDNEVMTVTGATPRGDGTINWTVLRGQAGTSAAGHASGTFVNTAGPAMSASQTTLTVANTVGFPPATSPFLIEVGSEIMQVTSANPVNLDGTTTWNVVRGQGGTTAVSHNEHAQVMYDSATQLALNSYYNAAIDALFTKYNASNPSPQTLTVHSVGSGTDLTYTGTVVQNADNAYVLRFNTTGDSTNYDVYYPFFTDNAYFYSGYTPALTPTEAPSWSAAADLSSMSPSTMVFSCNGVFADNKFRAAEFDATQQKVIADLENQVVSALNRGVAQLAGYSATGADSWADDSYYYNNVKNTTGQVWNQYAEFLHKSTISIDGKNYGFAFDDQDGHASDISVADASGATITLSPWTTAGVNPNPNPNPNPDPSQISLRSFLASTPPVSAVPPLQSSLRVQQVASAQPSVSAASVQQKAVDAAMASIETASSSSSTVAKKVAAKPASTVTTPVTTLSAAAVRSILASRFR